MVELADKLRGLRGDAGRVLSKLVMSKEVREANKYGLVRQDFLVNCQRALSKTEILAGEALLLHRFGFGNSSLEVLTIEREEDGKLALWWEAFEAKAEGGFVSGTDNLVRIGLASDLQVIETLHQDETPLGLHLFGKRKFSGLTIDGMREEMEKLNGGKYTLPKKVQFLKDEARRNGIMEGSLEQRLILLKKLNKYLGDVSGDPHTPGKDFYK